METDFESPSPPQRKRERRRASNLFDSEKPLKPAYVELAEQYAKDAAREIAGWEHLEKEVRERRSILRKNKVVEKVVADQSVLDDRHRSVLKNCQQSLEEFYRYLESRRKAHENMLTEARRERASVKVMLETAVSEHSEFVNTLGASCF